MGHARGVKASAECEAGESSCLPEQTPDDTPLNLTRSPHIIPPPPPHHHEGQLVCGLQTYRRMCLPLTPTSENIEIYCCKSLNVEHFVKEKKWTINTDAYKTLT